jgi:DNA polymerase-1
VVACFDRPSFRKDLFAGYKAKRPPKALGLEDCLRDAPETLGRVATIAAEDGFEADDHLASLAAIGTASGQRVILATGDKDVRQCLVDDWVTQLRGFRMDHGQVMDCEWFTAKCLREQMGLEPAQWVSYQALCGDHGDNIPGCEGFGEKTTLAVLKVAGNLAGCFANPLALPITPRLRNKLLQFRWNSDLMLKLVTLRTDSEAAKDALR